uniref:FLZ-type domain-containing protein n=1 Tax=Macrostomum lignano TaxID=282301 RepID=A0A1I8FLX7_9PLAT
SILYRSLVGRVIRNSSLVARLSGSAQYSDWCDPSRPVTLIQSSAVPAGGPSTAERWFGIQIGYWGDRSGRGAASGILAAASCGVVWFWVGTQPVYLTSSLAADPRSRWPLLQLFNYLEGDREQYLYMRLFCCACCRRSWPGLYRPSRAPPRVYALCVAEKETETGACWVLPYQGYHPIHLAPMLASPESHERYRRRQPAAADAGGNARTLAAICCSRCRRVPRETSPTLRRSRFDMDEYSEMRPADYPIDIERGESVASRVLLKSGRRALVTFADATCTALAGPGVQPEGRRPALDR